MWVFHFARELVTQFKQRGSIFYVFFPFSGLCIEGLLLLDYAQQVCGNCYLSMHLLAIYSENKKIICRILVSLCIYIFTCFIPKKESNLFLYLYVFGLTDLGVFFALSIHLMGSLVGCWTIWLVLVVSPIFSYQNFVFQSSNLDFWKFLLYTEIFYDEKWDSCAHNCYWDLNLNYIILGA